MEMNFIMFLVYYMTGIKALLFHLKKSEYQVRYFLKSGKKHEHEHEYSTNIIQNRKTRKS